MNAPTPTPSWLMYLQILNFLLTWGTAAYVYWDRRRDAASKRLASMEGRLQKAENSLKSMDNSIKNPPADSRWEPLETRLVAIEAAVKNPGQCSNHRRMEENDVKLFGRLDALHGDIRELTGGVKRLAGAVDMINEHLLKERK